MSFDAFIEPARARCEIWRLLLGVLIFAVVSFIGAAAVYLAWEVAIQALSGDGTVPALRFLDPAAQHDPWNTVVGLLTFLGFWLGLLAAVKVLHRRPLASLVSSGDPAWTRNLCVGLAIGLTFVAVTTALTVVTAAPVERNLSFDRWAAYIGPIIILTGMQVSAEELLFRGYLLQQLAVRSRHYLVWAVVPAALFGALHYNSELPGGAALYYIAATFVYGLCAATLVWRTGSLWAAIGLHFGINVIGLGVITVDGMHAGAQLWIIDAEVLTKAHLTDVVPSLLLLAFLLSPLAPFPTIGQRRAGRSAA